jgi:hypothetical protein
MHHPNEILNSLSNSILKSQNNTILDDENNQDWSLLLCTNSLIDPDTFPTEQHMPSDSIHLYLFDLN